MLNSELFQMKRDSLCEHWLQESQGLESQCISSICYTSKLLKLAQRLQYHGKISVAEPILVQNELRNKVGEVSKALTQSAKQTYSYIPFSDNESLIHHAIKKALWHFFILYKVLIELEFWVSIKHGSD
jgi:hypothetical protein